MAAWKLFGHFAKCFFQIFYTRLSYPDQCRLVTEHQGQQCLLWWWRQPSLRHLSGLILPKLILWHRELCTHEVLNTNPAYDLKASARQITGSNCSSQDYTDHKWQNTTQTDLGFLCLMFLKTSDICSQRFRMSNDVISFFFFPIFWFWFPTFVFIRQVSPVLAKMGTSRSRLIS